MTIGTRAARAGAGAGGEVRAVPERDLLVAQHVVELGNEPRRGVEALHHLVVAAVRGEAGAFPSAERFAAQNQQRRARAKLQTGLEQRVEDVDLRLAALHRLEGLLDARRVCGGGRRRGRPRLFDRLFQLGDALLDVRGEVDGIDVGLDALQGRFELRIDDDADVFDRSANLRDHPFDRLADVSLDRARDFLAPHGHKSSGCCRLTLIARASRIIAHARVLLCRHQCGAPSSFSRSSRPRAAATGAAPTPPANGAAFCSRSAPPLRRTRRRARSRPTPTPSAHSWNAIPRTAAPARSTSGSRSISPATWPPSDAIKTRSASTAPCSRTIRATPTPRAD